MYLTKIVPIFSKSKKKYCKKLEKCIEDESSIGEVPAVKEKLNLLKETTRNTNGQMTFSKDADGHKSADSFLLCRSFYPILYNIPCNGVYFYQPISITIFWSNSNSIIRIF